VRRLNFQQGEITDRQPLDRFECAKNRFAIAWVGLACFVLVGCGRAPTAAAPESPLVTVSVPVEREVTDYKDFTGRTDAVQSVSVRARVSGYLTKIAFKEGIEVKEGDTLFEIDPRPYQAQLDQATGQFEQAQANVQLSQANYQRARELAKRPVAAITPQDLDTAAAQLATNKGQMTVAQAAVDSARLNVDFCTVRSPIDGRISRYFITVGNLVTQDQTQLTTIVSQDPMYGYFDVDEQTMLDVQKLIREGKMKSARDVNNVPVEMQLANETGYPHRGTLNFVDNRVDPSTGTLQVRGVFPNPLIHGSRVLSPGLFVRVRVFIGAPYRAILISEQAVTSDQGQDLVYVVNAADAVEYRRVTLGEVHGGLRVVSRGLKAGEQIIVRGLQRVQPGMKVRTKGAEMPQAAPVFSGTSAATTAATTSAQPASASPAYAMPAKKPGSGGGED
jgi:RND family efflux transporter MFP subunit